jgi:hypothetical protein
MYGSGGSGLYLMSSSSDATIGVDGSNTSVLANGTLLLGAGSGGITLQGTTTATGDVAMIYLYTHGIASRAGIGGGYSGNMSNFNWSGNLEYWVNNTWVGYVSFLTSDARLKRDIGVLPVGLDAVLRLQPRVFEWLDADRSGGSHYGLMAQEVATVLPVVARHGAAVTPQTPDGAWLVDYQELMPVIIKATQELEARTHALAPVALAGPGNRFVCAHADGQVYTSVQPCR